MKFTFVVDDSFGLGPDGRWYTIIDYAVDYMLKSLPQITEFVLWGRLLEIEKTEGKFQLPAKVANCTVRMAGPRLKRKHRGQWPVLIARNFFPLKEEIKSSDIVLLRMPAFFPMLAYHFLEKKQIVVMFLIGNAEETIPLMVPWARWIAPLIGWYCRKITRRADFSGFMSQVLIDRYAKDCSNVVVCNNCRYPRDIIVEKRSADVSNPPRIIYLGRLSVEKGLDILFKAIKLLNEKMDIHLDIFGSGPMQEELEQLADKLGITGIITWHGRVAGKPLFDAFYRADTFVLSSFSEGMPSTIPEAASQGLPIVATDVGGVREILKNGQAGLIVPANDPEALSAALERSVTDMELRKRLIKESLQIAQENCLENQAGRLIEGIANLIRSRTP
jgi:glycosyltransferase involved in cell wall biosynthesis